MRLAPLAGIVAMGSFLAGCHTDMWVQPKHHHPYQKTELFADGNSSRPRVEGTVARGMPKTDEARTTGFLNGKLVSTIPSTLEIQGEKVDTVKEPKKVLAWGQERYHIYCSHCHGEVGDGQGMITQRGLVLKRAPASYHTDRLRKMPIGHFYDVMTNGFGTMFLQASRVPPDDRWAIAAYIRALQLSQDAGSAEPQAGQAAGRQESTNP